MTAKSLDDIAKSMAEKSTIAANLQELWNVWNIRGFVMLSLCLQLVLGYRAPFRRSTTSKFTIFVVWLAYLLADWAAVYAFGLISNTARNISLANFVHLVNEDLLAFWASFLMIHLGGPDTITAFSLEDNNLWLRHLVGLVAQVFVFFYIFLKTLPSNCLLAPTIMVLVTGVVRYAERTRALYLASLESLKNSIVPRQPIIEAPTETVDREGKHENELELKQAIHFFQIFKGLVVDVMPNKQELQNSRRFFLEVDADNAFTVISRELSLFYEVLYTKIVAVYSSWGVYSRTITYFSCVASFVLFCRSGKEQIHGVDVGITYSLFIGVFLVDLNRTRMQHTSDWFRNTENIRSVCAMLQAICFSLVDFIVLIPHEIVLILCCCQSERLWSESMGAFNLLTYCFEECPRKGEHSRPLNYFHYIFVLLVDKLGLSETVDNMKYTIRNAFDENLWRFIFLELRQRAMLAEEPEKAREIHDSKGDWVLRSRNCTELIQYTKGFEYDRVLLAWHVATKICYNIDGGSDEDNDGARKFGKILLDYMLYLLLQKRKMMSTVSGIGHIRYKDTCVELKELGTKYSSEEMKSFCLKLIEEHSRVEPEHEKVERGESVLSDACGIARTVMQSDETWTVLAKVWIDLLCYAARHCRADSHGRVLSEGGELITFVWLLMAHFDLLGGHLS